MAKKTASTDSKFIAYKGPSDFREVSKKDLGGDLEFSKTAFAKRKATEVSLEVFEALMEVFPREFDEAKAPEKSSSDDELEDNTNIVSTSTSDGSPTGATPTTGGAGSTGMTSGSTATSTAG